MSIAIWWLRRDLRLHDNQALHLALEQAEVVIPLFILDAHLLRQAAPQRQAFLFNCLHSLSADLISRGNRLLLLSGHPLEQLSYLRTRIPYDLIAAEADVSPYARRRDAAIARQLPLRLVEGLTIQPVGAAVKADGSPYTIFTPFSRAWRNLPAPGLPLPAPSNLPALDHLPLQELSIPIPEQPPHPDFPAGESAALQCLQDFLNHGIDKYHLQRNLPAVEGTSRLSPYIRFGCLSSRHAYAQCAAILQSAKKSSAPGAAAWLNELLWREFYLNILSFFPHVLSSAFRASFSHVAWRDAPADLTAWQAGLTGYPLVDAAMRQLAHTGWMHNRARMLTASFLTKHLLVNWQAGEAWFMRSLLDGDPSSNNGGWQWCAGSGTDAVPYFRIFNPILQSRKFDPRGDYIRAWLPELRALPMQYLHEPWLTPPDVQSSCGVHIGRTYPAPIVEHAFARQRALAAYKAAARA